MNTPKRILYALAGLCLPVLAQAQTCSYPTNILTVAGSHVKGYSGDNGAGTAAQMKSPWSVCNDAAGNLYFADYFNNAVRKVDHSNGIITTIAGDGAGTAGFAGDNGPATAALLNGPAGVTILGTDLYIADKFNERIRKVDLIGGNITTVAGNGHHGEWGGYHYNDNGPATDASLTYPIGVHFDCFNHMYIVDWGSQSIRRVDLATDTITLFAGTHGGGYNGDNIPATAAKLYAPSAVVSDCSTGDVYIADSWNNRIRKVSAATDTITTYAGTGDSLLYEGDGGDASAAKLWIPWGIALDPCDGLFICDYNNNAVRFVDGTTHIISTVAGRNVRAYDGDGGDADSAGIYLPSAIAINPDLSLYIADYGNLVIRYMGALGYSPRAYNRGTTQRLTVDENSAATPINELMAVPATGSQTWTISAYPSHGTLHGFPATSSASSGTAMPTGVSYTPSFAYTGDDQFTVVMNDGTTKASTTVSVKVNPFVTGVASTTATTIKQSVSPNPNSGSFKCEFMSEKATDFELKAADVTGRVIYTQTVHAVAGANSVNINLPASIQRPALIMVSLGNDDVKYPNTKVVVE